MILIVIVKKFQVSQLRLFKFFLVSRFFLLPNFPKFSPNEKYNHSPRFYGLELSVNSLFPPHNINNREEKKKESGSQKNKSNQTFDADIHNVAENEHRTGYEHTRVHQLYPSNNATKRISRLPPVETTPRGSFSSYFIYPRNTYCSVFFHQINKAASHAAQQTRVGCPLFFSCSGRSREQQQQQHLSSTVVHTVTQISIVHNRGQ